jgi:hypothetical protein
MSFLSMFLIPAVWGGVGGITTTKPLFLTLQYREKIGNVVVLLGKTIKKKNNADYDSVWCFLLLKLWNQLCYICVRIPYQLCKVVAVHLRETIPPRLALSLSVLSMDNSFD